VTAACLIELARAYQPKLILLGRTRLVDLVAQFPGLPRDVDQATIKRYLIQRAQAAGGLLDLAKIAQQSAGIAAIAEIEQTLAALRQAGSQVIYRDADVNDVASVAEALVTVRKQFGPISGIVHAAGVLADKLIQDKTPEQFRRVFATKVAGMEALFKATEQDPIRLIVAFSSVSARYGNAGQCDYAAGNEVLNQLIAVEARRRGSECLAKSLSWGPWEGGMVTPGLAAQFKARGVGMIPLQDGARQFVAEVSSTHGSPQIVLGHGEDVTHLGARLAHRAKEQTTVDFLINSRTFPMLAGHVIRDENPTLPMVFAVELFSRVAEMRAPEMEVAGCADLRMLRGVIVTDYLGSGVVLRVDAKPVEGSAVRCELRSRAGDLHYSGRILLRARTAEKSDGFLTAEPEPVESPENVRAQYPPNGNFHGAEFQVIRTIEQVDEATASTTLAGVIRMGWQPGPWVTDSAALDGAVQTVGLWYHVNRGAQLLPTRLGQYLQHKAGLFRGPFRCEVRCRHTGSRSVISDLLLRSPNGEPIAELQDLEMHALQVAHEQEAYV
jgi:NAD(P)-dependent dehydrogenase (short-subunit alcohol dehydrogenase family)